MTESRQRKTNRCFFKKVYDSASDVLDRVIASSQRIPTRRNRESRSTLVVIAKLLRRSSLPTLERCPVPIGLMGMLFVTILSYGCMTISIARVEPLPRTPTLMFQAGVAKVD